MSELYIRGGIQVNDEPAALERGATGSMVDALGPDLLDDGVEAGAIRRNTFCSFTGAELFVDGGFAQV